MTEHCTWCRFPIKYMSGTWMIDSEKMFPSNTKNPEFCVHPSGHEPKLGHHRQEAMRLAREAVAPGTGMEPKVDAETYRKLLARRIGLRLIELYDMAREYPQLLPDMNNEVQHLKSMLEDL